MSILYPDLSNTTFPNSKDTFKQFLDIVISDGNLIKQYQAAVQAGNSSLATQILQQIPAYTQKVLTATDLNKFVDAIIAVERFYDSDIKPYVNEKQAEWQDIIDQFEYRGVFNATTQYLKNNYVSFINNGIEQLYIALSQPPVGTVPTNTTYWRIFSVRGPRGLSGEGLSFVGDWVASTSYTAQDCVNYDNALWGALQDSTGQVPYEGSVYWSLLYRGVTTIYPVTATQPSMQQDGELWFKILT